MKDSRKYANIVERETKQWKDINHTCVGYIDDVSQVVARKNLHEVQEYIQDLYELLIKI